MAFYHQWLATGRRYYPLRLYLRQVFGGPVRKISVDAGFGCPNRDGTLGRGGCIFCNPESYCPSRRTAGGPPHCRANRRGCRAVPQPIWHRAVPGVFPAGLEYLRPSRAFAGSTPGGIAAAGSRRNLCGNTARLPGGRGDGHRGRVHATRHPSGCPLPPIGGATILDVWRYGADWTAAGRGPIRRHIGERAGLGRRKVRAPQDRVVGNAHRPRGQGKCNRKQTAPREISRGVRVKR